MIHSQFIRSTRIELSAFVRMSAARLIKWYRISQLCQQFCTTSFQQLVSAHKCWFSLGYFLMQRRWSAKSLYGIYLRFVSSFAHQHFSIWSAQTSVDFPLASFWCRLVLRCRVPYGIYLRFVSSSTHKLFSMWSAQTSVDFPLASFLMQKC